MKLNRREAQLAECGRILTTEQQPKGYLTAPASLTASGTRWDNFAGSSWQNGCNESGGSALYGRRSVQRADQSVITSPEVALGATVWALTVWATGAMLW